MDYNTIFVGMDVHKEKFSLCCYSIERMSSLIPIQQLPIIVTYSPISLPCGAYSEKMRLSCAVMRPDAWGLRYIIN